MNLQNDPQSFALMKFGIGQPVLRAKAKEMEREFARRLQAAFAEGA